MASATLRLRSLVREGIATAWSQRLPTVITALVTATVCGVILATTGQSAAAEQRVLSRIDDVGTRTIRIEDFSGAAGMSPLSVGSVSQLSGVRWAIGVGPVNDVRNAALGGAGQPVPSRALYGALPAAIRVTGRPPTTGEALVSQQGQVALGLSQPAGGVTGIAVDAAVVGAFTADAPLQDLNGSTLILADARPIQAGSGTGLRRIYVMAEDVHAVDPLTTAVRAALSAEDASQIRIETPRTILDLRTVVAGDLGQSGRRIMLLVLGVGLLLVATTLFGAVSTRRREFGRRRALGASRSAVVTIVLMHSLVSASVGVLLGTTAGLLAVWRTAGSFPAPEFTAGVAVLALLVAFVASVPPALLAAYRDPVRILRVP